MADQPIAADVVEPQRCDGDHTFEDVCNDCGGAQPSGLCAVCPHLPMLAGQRYNKREHYARRPCPQCGCHNLRTVRVRARS